MRGVAAPYEGPEPYVFISYCHQDLERVYPYIRMMARDGYRVWYDEGITPGEDWTENIARHLEGSSVFLAFITKASMNSHNCRREINFAIQRNKNFVSLFLDDFPLSAGMEMLLSSVQGIYRSRYVIAEDFMRKLYSTAVLEQCRDDNDRSVRGKSVLSDEDATVTLTQGSAGLAAGSLETFLLRVSTLEKIQISKSGFTIGRSEKMADYVITGDNSISRIHAMIRRIRDAYTITDNKSLNHVGINGRMIAPGIEYEMEPFSIISLAKEHFVFFKNFSEPDLRLLPGYDLRGRNETIRLSRQPVLRIGSRPCDGSGRGNEICLSGEGIFPSHMILIMTTEGLYGADIAGRHSTVVNGRPLRFCEKTMLRPGDTLSIGSEPFEVIRRI